MPGGPWEDYTVPSTATPAAGPWVDYAPAAAKPGFGARMVEGSSLLSAAAHPLDTLKSLTGIDQVQSAMKSYDAGDKKGAAMQLLKFVNSNPATRAASGLVDTSKEQFGKAWDAVKKGDYDQAVNHFNAGILPIIAPTADGIDLMKAGDIKGGLGLAAGNAVDLVAADAVPIARAAGRGATAAVDFAKTPGALKMLGGAAEVAGGTGAMLTTSPVGVVVGADRFARGVSRFGKGLAERRAAQAPPEIPAAATPPPTLAPGDPGWTGAPANAGPLQQPPALGAVPNGTVNIPPPAAPFNPYTGTTDPGALAARTAQGEASLAAVQRNPAGILPGTTFPETPPAAPAPAPAPAAAPFPIDQAAEALRRRMTPTEAMAQPTPQAAAPAGVIPQPVIPEPVAAPAEPTPAAKPAPAVEEAQHYKDLRKKAGDQGADAAIAKDNRLADWATHADHPTTADELKAMTDQEFADWQKGVPTGKVNAKTGKPTLHAPRVSDPDFGARKQAVVDLVAGREASVNAKAAAGKLADAGTSFAEAKGMTNEQLGVPDTKAAADALFELKKLELAPKPAAPVAAAR